MSGIALIIPNIYANKNNLGKINFKGIYELNNISIICENIYSAISFNIDILYNPINTLSSQKGIEYSIIAGNEYASINSATGIVTINQIAVHNTITIKATSTYNSEIYTTKNVEVTYYDPRLTLNSITNVNAEKIDLNTYKLTPVFDPIETLYNSVTYSCDNQNITINNDEITILPTFGNVENNITIRCTSNYNSSIYYDKILTVSYTKEPEWDLGEYVGMINLMNGLGEELVQNNHTIYIKFANEMNCTFNGSNTSYNYGIYSIGAQGNNDLNVYTSSGWGHFCFGGGYSIQLGASSLYNSSWTTTNKGNGNNMKPTNYTQYMCAFKSNVSGTTLKDLIQGKTYIITNDATYIDDENISTSESINYSTKTPGNKGLYAQYITFGFSVLNVDTANNLASPKDLILNNGISNSTGKLQDTSKSIRIKELMIVPGHLTTISQVKAAVSNAYVNIKFDTNGIPYNTNTNYPLLVSTVAEINSALSS